MRRTLANKYKWIPNTRQATSLKFGSDLSDDGEHGDAPVVQLLATLGLRFRVALPVLFGALQGLIYGAGTTRTTLRITLAVQSLGFVRLYGLKECEGVEFRGFLRPLFNLQKYRS